MEHKKIIFRLFHLLLFFLAAYYVVKQFLQFLKNEDSSAMAFKRFNSFEKDKYPTFSVCLAEEFGNWHDMKTIENFYQANKINETLGISVLDYYELLIGMGFKKDPNRKTNFSTLEFDQAKRNMLNSMGSMTLSVRDEELQNWYKKVYDNFPP